MLDQTYFGDGSNVQTQYLASFNHLCLSFPSLALASKREAVASVVADIYDGKFKPEEKTVHPSLFDAYNSNYQSAIRGDIAPQRESMLRNNLARTASAKAGSVQDELFKIKAAATSRKDYEAAAKEVIARHNRFQVAEYNAAVHRGRVVKQWQQFQRERHLYPNVEWLRTRSATPREVHLAYVGRVWPMDDPFFINNHPGCTWGCKCSWRTTDAQPTDNADIKPVPPSPGLAGNPYETGEIFSSNHPYFGRVSPHVPELGPLMCPDDIAYIKLKTPGGNEYRVHYNELIIESDDTTKQSKKYLVLQEHKKIVADLLDGENPQFNDIRLLPQIHTSEKALRERYFGKIYNDKNEFSNPDAIIDSNIVEFKLASRHNIFLRITEAALQSSIVCIKLREAMTVDYIERRIANGTWSRPDCITIKTLIIINNGKPFVFNRP